MIELVVIAGAALGGAAVRTARRRAAERDRVYLIQLHALSETQRIRAARDAAIRDMALIRQEGVRRMRTVANENVIDGTATEIEQRG